MTTSSYRISGGDPIGRLARSITDNWLLGLRRTNPAIIDIFRERDKKPYRDLLPWSGEFAGKYITGAYYIYKLTNDGRIPGEIAAFIDELVSTQASDGYLGCYSKECRLTGAFSQDPCKKSGTWDSWSHYHIMLGIILWYGETGKREWLDCVFKAAELFINTFYRDDCGGRRIVDMESSEMNLSVIHAFAMLYRMTGDKKYLDFAENIVRDLSDARAGDYIGSVKRGEDYYQCAKPRWESLHIIIGLAELYRANGNEDYFETARHIFYSILKTDVHNTGAFSTAEQAVGDPFTKGAIETCCVIAYNALAVEIYRLTGDTAILDHLELSLYNACMGFWSPTGRWSTYDTPMEGHKYSNTTSIVFQSRPGSPELNCCSVNAPRGIGMLSEWAVAEDKDTVYINAFAAASAKCGNGAAIDISGNYPYDGEIQIKAEDFTGNICVRIPSWSKDTILGFGGRKIPVISGEYISIPCEGAAEIDVSLDMSLRYASGEKDFAGKTCVYRGPLLLGTDSQSCGDHDAADLPEISKDEIENAVPEIGGEDISLDLASGITLKEFSRLGVSGGYYTTWLKIK
ncbi:MAG: glycoside hydrolase family 127 protein [Clostridiales bacterium]|nr:glycoside hydrolase family 127 protein [Clostridiales bacterium]